VYELSGDDYSGSKKCGVEHSIVEYGKHVACIKTCEKSIYINLKSGVIAFYLKKAEIKIEVSN
jgi:hypothetical protein